MATFRELSDDYELRLTEILMDPVLSIIVEGPHDKLTLERFFDKKFCHIEQFDGKENVEQVIKDVNQKNPLSAIAIIDPDLDFMEAILYADNVFPTDGHDLDVQLFFSDAFYRVCREFFSETNTETRTKMDGIRNKVISFGLPLAHMRVLSKEKKWGFAFKASKDHNKPFPYKKLVDINKHKCNYLGDDKLIQVTCCYRNQGAGKDPKTIKAGLKEIETRNYDKQLVLHGHDLMNLLGLVVVYYGVDNSSTKDVEEVEMAFRLTYHKEFYKTKLFQKLNQYATDHTVPFISA